MIRSYVQAARTATEVRYFISMNFRRYSDILMAI